MISNTKVESILGSKIKDIKLYQQAFTHKSSIENSNESNERLEFIGDSVLSLIVTKYLYEKYPNENEGFLTRIRTKLVSGKALSKIAFQLSFHEFIVMNEKGMKNEWNKNPRLLEDALEAFIGSIYLDMGLEVASTFIYKYHPICATENRMNRKYITIHTRFRYDVYNNIFYMVSLIQDCSRDIKLYAVMYL